MADPQADWDEKRQYQETLHPDNPPNSVMNRTVGRAMLYTYLGPIIVLFVIFAIGLIYWDNKHVVTPPARGEIDQAVGTAGQTSPGGFNPKPQASSTSDELARRGGVDDQATGRHMPGLHDRTPLTSIDEVLQRPNDVAGRSVNLDNVTVDSAQGHSFWVRHGDSKVEVVAPSGASMPQKGAHVHVVGTVEPAGSSTRIQASSVENR